MPKRTPVPCPGKCGRRTERACGWCMTCRPADARQAQGVRGGVPPEPVGLYGGRWVTRGLVAHWVPNQPRRVA